MADKRINALTTTSASVGDDYFAIDGATNGTRALSAFSPTFGGNATVTGTLTANGATGTFGSSASSGTSLKVISGVGTLAAPKYSTLDFRTYNDSGTGAYIRTGNRQSDTNEWLLEIAARSNADVLTSVATFGASGTTFAGPLTGGNVVKSANSAAANGTEFIALRAEVGADATLGPTLVTIGALPSATGASRYGFIASYDSNDWRTLYLGGSPGVAANGGQVRVPANISSTSTSSGALVVSGGVGVAGSINTDGTLRFNANSSLPGTGSLGISSTYGLNFYASTGSSYDFTVFSAAGQSILLVPTGTRNVSFSGTLTTVGNITSGAAITTSAPVGGAGLWELGLYSSTAPSATGYVTIEIGGTVYKLLASNV